MEVFNKRKDLEDILKEEVEFLNYNLYAHCYGSYKTVRVNVRLLDGGNPYDKDVSIKGLFRALRVPDTFKSGITIDEYNINGETFASIIIHVFGQAHYDLCYDLCYEKLKNVTMDEYLKYHGDTSSLYVNMHVSSIRKFIDYRFGCHLEHSNSIVQERYNNLLDREFEILRQHIEEYLYAENTYADIHLFDEKRYENRLEFVKLCKKYMDASLSIYIVGETNATERIFSKDIFSIDRERRLSFFFDKLCNRFSVGAQGIYKILAIGNKERKYMKKALIPREGIVETDIDTYIEIHVETIERFLKYYFPQ